MKDQSNKYICIGAGCHGEIVWDQLGTERIECFMDNYKTGSFHGIPIFSFEEITQEKNKRFVLTADKKEIRDQLKEKKIPYIDFNLSDVWGAELDKVFWEDYLKAEVYAKKITRKGNWFREINFYSEKNKKLIEMMKKGEDYSHLLEDTYKNILVYSDEYYEVRPEMRLIQKAINANRNGRIITICDMASGYGDMLRHIRTESISCWAIELDARRADSLNREGISCRVGSAEQTGFEREQFDVVTCLACLEHVEDPFLVVGEAYRIMKRDGYFYVSVPDGDSLNCDEHVRDFSEDDLASVLLKEGFKCIKIIKISYLNNIKRTILFAECRK